MAKTAITLYLHNATWHMDITGELLPDGRMVGMDTGYSAAYTPESILREFRRNGYGKEFAITVREPRLGAKYANLAG